MGQDPDAIRQEIEETRGQMGETVEAIGYKADVKGRAKDSITGKKDALKSKVSGATPSSGEVKQSARQAVGVAQENPLGLAVGSIALGFLAGMLVPTTRVENEKIGPLADDVKEKAKETGQEALERGKHVASEAAQAAADTAKETGQEHAEGLKSSAQQSAQQVRSGA